MKRDEKIQLLQAIKDGLLMPEDIRPAKVIVLIQKREGGWKTESLKKEVIHYTNKEFKILSKDFEAASQKRVNCGLKPDIMIKVLFVNTKTIF